MTRPIRRASQVAVDKLHKLTAEELSRQLTEARKAATPVSAALLASAIAFLRLTGTNEPAQPKVKDRLRGLLPDADELGSVLSGGLPRAADLDTDMSPS